MVLEIEKGPQVRVGFLEVSIEVFEIGGSGVLGSGGGSPHAVSTSRSRPAVVHGPFEVDKAGAGTRRSVLQVPDAVGAA